MSKPYQIIDDLGTLVPDAPADSITSRTFYKDARLSAVLFSFAAGQELSEHTSAFPAILHFLSGSARLTLGEDTMIAGPGTWARMDPQLPHSVYAETPVVMLLLMLRD